MDDDLIARACQLRRRLEELIPEVDHVRGELREVVGRLAAAGVPDHDIAAATGIHPRKVDRIGRGGADLVVCAFCRRERTEVAQIIAGPGVYICDGCIRTADLREPTAEVCSFCGKGSHQITAVHVAAEGRATICEECVALCQQILDEGVGGSQP